AVRANLCNNQSRPHDDLCETNGSRGGLPAFIYETRGHEQTCLGSGGNSGQGRDYGMIRSSSRQDFPQLPPVWSPKTPASCHTSFGVLIVGFPRQAVNAWTVLGLEPLGGNGLPVVNERRRFVSVVKQDSRRHTSPS
ncbi:uncharacterized protein CCOS01_04816, partial [Colletotrichum costaricense]